MTRGAPLRFLAGSVGGWIVLRFAVTMLPILGAALAGHPAGHTQVAAVPAGMTPVPHARSAPVERELAADGGARSRTRVADDAPAPATSTAAPPAPRASPAQAAVAITPVPPDPPAAPDAVLAALAPVPAPAADGERRWSGSAWLFVRGDGAGRALAPGGQLGGGQAGARVAYRIADHLALAARLSSPTGDGRGAEAAGGVDWLPFGRRVALRASIERRAAIGADARNAWSAYVAGGFYRPIGGAAVDGYAQAGVVGARRRDLFADGAIRAGARLPLSAKIALTLGAGAWGAAQPHAERLDIGPRAALGLPLGAATATFALEARIRVAGAARPGSGLALTLAGDF